MKIAYLLLVHSNPVLLGRTITALSSSESGFFVHVDLKTDVTPFRSSKGDNVCFSSERIPVYWGEFSQVDATLMLLEQALGASEHYKRFVFLQGSTYPLRSARAIEGILADPEAEFINAAAMPAPGYPLSKINTLRYPSHKPIRRLASKALGKLGLATRDYRDYLGSLQPYAGHACWALSRAACEHIVEFTRSKPRVSEYFRNTFAPDESYFHTVFGNSPYRSRARKIFVYADWSDSAGDHPALLTERQIGFFEQQEKVWIDDEWGAGEMLFARKFSDERLDLVDRVDEMIRRKDSELASVERDQAICSQMQ